MDLVAWYEAYWSAKDDTVDHSRLNLLLPYIQAGQRVFQLDGGPGMLAERMVRERGAQVVMTDLTQEATRRARAKSLEASQLYIGDTDIPHSDASFDAVVSDSAIEHHFDPARSFDELARVLKPGGVFLLCLPNAAHWRCRWWLLRGRFPYVRGTPTDFTHLRFFTLNEIRHWLSDRDIAIQHVDGSASLWVRGLYPAWLRRPPFATLYVRLAHRFPTFFARDLIVIGRKGPESTQGLGGLQVEG
jgi:ubiquinone/menaquinone biosynthesis C-methylase UbiE